MSPRSKHLLLFLAPLVLLQVGLFFYPQHSRAPVIEPQGESAASETALNVSPVRIIATGTVLSKSSKQLTALFVGDMMLDRYVRTRIKAKGVDGLIKPLVDQRLFAGVNLASANLEGAVTDDGARYSPALQNDFAFRPADIARMQASGFDFFNLANNHLTDQGQRGIAETRANLDRLKLPYAGCPDGQVGECSGKAVRFGSASVALLGFSMVYKDFDLAAAAREIGKYRKQADVVIVNVHWGQEYQHRFSAKQQRTAHKLVEAGADVVIGHHPHVLQGVEQYRGKLIFYSLGNFVFDQYFSQATQEGLAVRLDWHGSSSKALLLPLVQKQSIVSLPADAKRRSMLKQIAGWSVGSTDFKGRVAEGEIVF